MNVAGRMNQPIIWARTSVRYIGDGNGDAPTT